MFFPFHLVSRRLDAEWSTSTHFLPTHIHSRRDNPRPHPSRVLHLSRGLQKTFIHLRSPNTTTRLPLERLGKHRHHLLFVRVFAPVPSSLLIWHNTALHAELEILSSGDSYTATGFNLNQKQPCPEDPFGNPTYDPISPYLKWIHYLTMTYNDSKVETYNFAVQGATVDQTLINRGSAFSTQEGEKFLPNYDGQGNQTVGGDNDIAVGKRKNRNSSSKSGPLATWAPETTLFSVWFGINDIVFSNRSEALFDRIFESYSRTLDQVRLPHLLHLLPSFLPCFLPFFLSSLYPWHVSQRPLTSNLPSAPHRRRPKLPPAKRTPYPPRSQSTQRLFPPQIHPLLERPPRRPRHHLRLHEPRDVRLPLRHLRSLQQDSRRARRF